MDERMNDANGCATMGMERAIKRASEQERGAEMRDWWWRLSTTMMMMVGNQGRDHETKEKEDIAAANYTPCSRICFALLCFAWFMG